VPLAIAGSYMKALSRCERRWLRRSDVDRPLAGDGKKSCRVPRRTLRRIELKLSPLRSFTAPLVRPPQRNSSDDRHAPRGTGGRTSGGRIGRLRSSTSSKLIRTSRLRRRLVPLAIAEGLQELKPASQHCPHRKQVFIYEPTNPSGKKIVADKNPDLKNPRLQDPRLTALTLRTQKNG
jgi:hypothetical protein